MTGSVTFVIPGRPTGKGRPKFARQGNSVRAYTDAKTASYENKVAVFAQQAMRGRAQFDGPICVSVLATFTPPRSASYAKTAAMLAGTMKPTVKPDLDNIVKAVLDGLQGVAFRDDVIVTWTNAGKRYGDTDQVMVTIEPDDAVGVVAVAA